MQAQEFGAKLYCVPVAADPPRRPPAWGCQEWLHCFICSSSCVTFLAIIAWRMRKHGTSTFVRGLRAACRAAAFPCKPAAFPAVASPPPSPPPPPGAARCAHPIAGRRLVSHRKCGASRGILVAEAAGRHLARATRSGRRAPLCGVHGAQEDGQVDTPPASGPTRLPGGSAPGQLPPSRTVLLSEGSIHQAAVGGRSAAQNNVIECSNC